YRIAPRFRLVKDGEELALAGEKIKIIYTPWLHWPETIMSYLPDRRALITCDVFGGYSTPRAIFDDDESVVKEYLPSVRKYVANIIGFYRQHITRNIEKIQSLKLSIGMLAPAHGLIWRRNPQLIIDYYRSLAEGRPDGNKILIITGSMYRLLEAAAAIAANEVERLGGRAIFYRFNDSSQPPFSEILSDAMDSRAIIIAATTYEAGVYPPLEHLVDLISRKIPQKPVLVIGSYGWGPAAARKISEKLASVGFKIIDKIEFQGSASEEDIRRIREGVKMLLELS
ncbi:MAG: FprA family A-type flavoprotein, partial [Nitrososphaerota archaeon]